MSRHTPAPDCDSVWAVQSPEQGLAQLATAQAEKAAERAREEGQRVKEAKAEAEAQKAEVDMGTTEAVKKARDAARQARKIASEAKAKAQVGMPFGGVLGSCKPSKAALPLFGHEARPLVPWNSHCPDGELGPLRAPGLLLSEVWA